MSEQPETEPQSEQVVRANRLREAISDMKRGIKPPPKTPRDFTDQAAAEAAREDKAAKR